MKASIYKRSGPWASYQSLISKPFPSSSDAAQFLVLLKQIGINWPVSIFGRWMNLVIEEKIGVCRREFGML